MRQLFAALLVALPLSAFAAGPGKGPGPGPMMAGPHSEQIAKLHREIAAAKLDRLLELNREQAQAVLPLLRDAVGAREQVRADKLARQAQIAAALERIRDDIKRDGKASEASAKALQDARGEAQAKQLRPKMRELQQKFREVLSPDQIARLRNFDPRPLAGPKAAAVEDDEPAPGAPMRMGKGHGAKGGKGMKSLARTAVSPEFLQLVESRAK